MPQFTKRSARPLTRETYQRASDDWSRACSRLDDYAIAGNERGITRTLNRLYRSVQVLRARHYAEHPHIADDYDAAQAEKIGLEDNDGEK